MLIPKTVVNLRLNQPNQAWAELCGGRYTSPLAALACLPKNQKNKLKQADRPDFVTASDIATCCYDNHSSRRRITPPLKLSTRTLREPPQRVPI